MANQNDERHYSDEEFAIILRTASEAPDGFPPARPPEPQDGLTLSEIKGIAAEVGIVPRRCLGPPPSSREVETSTLSKLFGGGSRFRMEHTVQGVVPTAGDRPGG